MDGGYAGLCLGDEIDPAAGRVVSEEVTTAFWDAHLKGDAQARQRLHAWPVPEARQGAFPPRMQKAQAYARVRTEPAGNRDEPSGQRPLRLQPP